MIKLSLTLALMLATLMSQSNANLGCDTANYRCWNSGSANIVYAMRTVGASQSDTCAKTCARAFPKSTGFYACNSKTAVPTDLASFSASTARGLGFKCEKGGCWGGVAGAPGQIWVGKDVIRREGSLDVRKCYLPDRNVKPTLACTTGFGNANCFGKRYTLVCPCNVKPLEQACEWESPPNNTKVAKWTNPNGRSCLERVNYWRQRACREKWFECPPAGLPPMVECTTCHECANSEAQWDSKYGAHKSFTRCGEFVQGEGGGNDCASVIDSFVRERKPDANGVWKCEGHCGPILRHGCTTFFWGRAKDSGFHTLNWNNCPVEKCTNYCKNPRSDSKCFRVPTSPSPPGSPSPSPSPPPPSPPPPSPPPPPKYLGCFIDARDRVFPHRMSGDYSVTTCGTKCAAKGYKYFGVQYGKECWCNNAATYAKHGGKRKESECHFDCKIDKTQKCGAGWRMNVYMR